MSDMNSPGTTGRVNKPSLLERIADMDDRALAVVLLAPAFVFISLVIVYPVATLLVQSFQDVRLLTGNPSRWVGIENYALVIGDPRSEERRVGKECA